MTKKISTVTYVVLQATRYAGPRDANGDQPASAMRVSRIRASRPPLEADEIAVRLSIEVDASLFNALVPQVEVSIDPDAVSRGEVIVGTVVVPEDTE